MPGQPRSGRKMKFEMQARISNRLGFAVNAYKKNRVNHLMFWLWPLNIQAINPAMGLV